MRDEERDGNEETRMILNERLEKFITMKAKSQLTTGNTLDEFLPSDALRASAVCAIGHVSLQYVFTANISVVKLACISYCETNNEKWPRLSCLHSPVHIEVKVKVKVTDSHVVCNS